MHGNGTDDTSDTALGRCCATTSSRDDRQGRGVETDVTGMTAGSKDFNDSMTAHLPIVFAFVLGLAFLLLLVTFRSIVVPLKAIVLNLLSVAPTGSSAVFQDGHGEHPLLEPFGGITSGYRCSSS